MSAGSIYPEMRCPFSALRVTSTSGGACYLTPRTAHPGGKDADYCGVCRLLLPISNRASLLNSGQILIAVVNIWCGHLKAIFGRRLTLGVQTRGFRRLLISFATCGGSSHLLGPHFPHEGRQGSQAHLLHAKPLGWRGLDSVCVGVLPAPDKVPSEREGSRWPPLQAQ